MGLLDDAIENAIKSDYRYCLSCHDWYDDTGCYEDHHSPHCGHRLLLVVDPTNSAGDFVCLRHYRIKETT